MPASRFPAICVMGVSGSGKTSIGEGLAARLAYAFLEGDRLHPAVNVGKMAKGIPLTDDDRWPWLDAIGAEIGRHLKAGEGLVLSCSALKRVYRDRLRMAAGDRLAFVYLDGSRDLLGQRMGAREGHFMPLSLLDSQLATLEVPSGEPDVATVAIDADVETIIARAVESLARL